MNGLQSAMLASNSTYIRAFLGAEVHDMLTLIHKVPNDYTPAKNVLICVGYKNCKNQVNENVTNDKIIGLIEKARATFLKVTLSAVLQGRHSKNTINIDDTTRSFTKCIAKMGLIMWI